MLVGDKTEAGVLCDEVDLVPEKKDAKYFKIKMMISKKDKGVKSFSFFEKTGNRFKYNITDKIQFGKPNLLEATVSKMSADVSVNNAERLADYWVLGGIFRPVFLEAVPKEFIDYTAINAKADGSFAMQVFLKYW